MSGNTFGTLFTVTTFGESHGPALGAIVDGCPPGLELSAADLMPDIERRRSGTSHFTSQRKEPDEVRILSGVFEGRTTGTSIGLLVENTDQRSRDYDKIKDRFRPGHADYTYQQKYGFRDYRGGGRSSARETVMRVAAGGIARKYLRERLGIEIFGYLSAIGPLDRPAPTTIRSFARTLRVSRSWSNCCGMCVRPAIRSAHASPWWRAACRRASASPCLTVWMRTWPTP